MPHKNTALQEYARKRDFKKTPEPGPRVAETKRPAMADFIVCSVMTLLVSTTIFAWK